jgi:D-serine deaminase-like pyridoxal phosphate-dependent protein
MTTVATPAASSAAASDAVTRTLPLALDPAAVLPVRLGDPALDTPAMLIDLDIAEANIASMAAFADRAGVRLRPHIKTHKSVAMARRQLDAGATGLCAATVTEAEVLARAGLTDITLAYPIVGTRKLGRLADVCRAADVTLVADSAAVVDGYREVASRIGRTLAVLVDVDTGMHRTGVPPAAVVALARHIRASAGLDLGGILTHAGHAHDVTSQPGIEQVARREAATMGDVRADLERAGFEVSVVSAGSSLTARYLSAGDGITEIRPGTYVYNDLRTLACWSCTPEQIAATMLATVISSDGSRVTVDAGSKTLTTTTDAVFGSGHLAGRPDSAFTRTSEEHGVLTVPGLPALTAGERVRILPVHVCVWSDLQPEIYGVRRGEIVERIRVEGFRHSL